MDQDLKPPLVSIIMPVYNAAEFVAAAIGSVLAQTYPNWQLVIINDGSDDDSRAIIKAQKVPAAKLLYLETKRVGPGAARNTGIAQAAGEHIAFLDADDIWEPTKLAVQMRHLADQPCDVIFCNGRFIDEQGKDRVGGQFVSAVGTYTGAEMFAILYQHNRIPLLSVLTTKKALQQAGAFKSTGLLSRKCEDYDLWLRLAAAGATFCGLPDKLVGYRIHEGSSTMQTLIMTQAELAVVEQYDKQVEADDPQRYKARRRELYNRLAAASAGAGDMVEARAYVAKLQPFASSLQVFLRQILLGLFGRRYATIYYRFLSKLA